MRTYILAAILALSAAPFSTAAFAGEGQGNPFPFRATSPVTAQIAVDTGTEQTPAFGRTFGTVEAGGIELPNGTNAPVESANSLPLHALDGTAEHLRAAAAASSFVGSAAVQMARSPSVAYRG